MPPPPGRPRFEASPGSSTTSASQTPRSQVQHNAALGLSPFSSGTFDALHRVAFPESPRLDQLLAGSDRPFSPRRLPPNQSPMALSPAAAFAASTLQTVNRTVAMSPQAYAAATRRNLTPNPNAKDPIQLSAQQIAYRLPNTTYPSPTAAAPAPLGFRQSPAQQREANSPMAYSPIPINTGAGAGNGSMDQEVPTPPMDSPFRRRLDMLRFLEDSGVASSPLAPREVPLPRASLAPRSRRPAPPRNQAQTQHQPSPQDRP